MSELTNKRCPNCKGSGRPDWYYEDICDACSGTGMILVDYDQEMESANE